MKSAAAKARRIRDRHKNQPYDPNAPWHGTQNGYDNRCCRCDRCREASRRYRNEWRLRPEVAQRIRENARERGRRPEAIFAKRAASYGLTAAQLRSLMAHGECAACGSSEPGSRGWQIDHDHYCCSGRKNKCGKCVRGILCSGCNVALGQVGDDPTRLRALADYIERWRRRASK